jgi:uncharacterized protein YpmB
MFDGISESNLKKKIAEASSFSNQKIELIAFREERGRWWEVEARSIKNDKIESFFIDTERGERRRYKSLDRMIKRLRDLGVNEIIIKIDV